MKKAELRVRLSPEDIRTLRIRAAMSGTSLPNYLRKVINENDEEFEKKKRDFRLF